MDILSAFYQQAKELGYTIEKRDKSTLLISREDFSYVMSNIYIESEDRLNQSLNRYYALLQKGELTYYSLKNEKSFDDYLFYLFKSLSNSDCNNFCGYVDKFCEYMEDRNFNELKKIIHLLAETLVVILFPLVESKNFSAEKALFI